jgi:ATP-dependent RNA helicase DHX37/DHR1
MAKLPIAPRYAKMLVLSERYNVVKFMVLTAAALSMEQVFDQEIKDEEGKVSKAAVKKQHAVWQNAKSDALGLLNLCIVFFSHRQQAAEKSKFEEDFCHEHSINLKSMREIGELSCQLLAVATSQKVNLDSHFGALCTPTAEEYDSVLKCIVGGFIDRVAMADPDPEDSWKATKRVPYLTCEHLDLSLCSEEYKASCPNKEYVFIHPSSYLFGRVSPGLIVYQDLIFTSRPYMRCITAVQPEWLLELGTHLVQPLSPLPVPLPSLANGVIKCWVEPAFGPKCWRLQAMQVDFPTQDSSLSLWVLRFLMEGKLVPGWKDTKEIWSIKPGNVTNPAASGTQKSIAKAINLLRVHSITSLQTLQTAGSPVLSKLHKALKSLVVPAQLPRFESLWSHLS